MDSYNAFASYYDGLMEDARYEERCRYILEAAQRIGHPMGRTLDLACGTGSLTLLLRQSGVDVFGADASADMLSLAMQKCTEAGETVLFVQDGALCAAGDAGAHAAGNGRYVRLYAGQYQSPD